ncbi:MAG: thermonuclease family protein [Moorella sp. (in: firmicutes)]
MARHKSSDAPGCATIIIYLIGIGLVISLISWLAKNIIGLAGLGLAGWGGYQAYKKYQEGQKYNIPAGLAVAGLVLGLSWFAFAGAPENPSSNKTAPSVSTSQVAQTETNSPQEAKSSETPSGQQSNGSTFVTKQEDNSSIPLIKTTVTKVIDGDTFEASINGRQEKIRLIGVDTPETVHPTQSEEPYGKEASNYTKSKLEGKEIWLEKDVQERDNYGRLLAYAWFTPPSKVEDKEIRDKMFNAILLLEGYAQVATYPPNVKYVDYFTKYQAEAREGNKGLWALNSEGNTQTTVTEVSSENKKEITVYVTKTGKKYHRDGCRSLAKSKIPMSLEDAKNSGYTPCSICNPPQ